jgi:hypothetical protein
MASPNSTTTQGSIDNPDTITIPVAAMANLANSQVLKIALPYAFTVTAALFRVGDKAVTTAAKAATATVQINGAAVTGGVMSLTSANCTPSGAAVAATAITANNGTFVPGSTLEVAISSVTAFLEGDGWFEFTVLPTSAG